MKYLVTFRKRFSADGKPAEEPQTLIDPGDGVIEDSEFVELVEPVAVAEELTEGDGSEESNDNGFPTFGTESWVFTVADGHEGEFTDTLKESRVVLAFEEIMDDPLTT